MEQKNNISTQALEELARAAQRRYKAEWRKKNKDKVREHNKRYWAKRALRLAEQNNGEGAVNNDR